MKVAVRIWPKRLVEGSTAFATKSPSENVYILQARGSKVLEVAAAAMANSAAFTTGVTVGLGEHKTGDRGLPNKLFDAAQRNVLIHGARGASDTAGKGYEWKRSLARARPRLHQQGL
jgi:hypothetical protein